MRIVLIDNYDSFTWNLVHLIGGLGAKIDVHRNNKISVGAVLNSQPDAIVLSPGPCTPNEAGICLELLARASATVPMLGICLGHQAMGQAFGGKVMRAPHPVHGKLSSIHHTNNGLFRGINGKVNVTRYHSLIVERNDSPSSIIVTAETDDGLIMGLQHRHFPSHGLQFHPESIASEHGTTMMRNFLDLAAEWNKTTGRVS